MAVAAVAGLAGDNAARPAAIRPAVTAVVTAVRAFRTDGLLTLRYSRYPARSRRGTACPAQRHKPHVRAAIRVTSMPTKCVRPRSGPACGLRYRHDLDHRTWQAASL